MIAIIRVIIAIAISTMKSVPDEAAVRPRLRSFIGVDFRYIDGYLHSCCSWDIMRLENGKIIFTGIPKEANVHG